jgi:RNA polymerase sigma-70 factor (ECF subfamily)
MSYAAPLPLEDTGPVARQGPDIACQVEEAYHCHYREMLAYLRVSGCQDRDAEEFLQEAFLRLVRALRDHQQILNVKYWLLRVVNNLRFDEMRRSSRIIPTEDQMLEVLVGTGDATAEADVLRTERLRRLRQAMEQLTDRQHHFLLLRAEGMKLSDIARLYGVSIVSVAQCVGRAMERLGKAEL